MARSRFSHDAPGIAPGMIGFEITEGLATQDTDDSVAAVKALQARGVPLAVDDFGTGHSSLACGGRGGANRNRAAS